MNKTVDYFNEAAPTYHLKSHQGLWGLLRRREAAVVKRELLTLPKSSALELGCGSGFYTLLLKDLGYKPITCVDASSAMLSLVEEKNCRKILADIESFQIPEKFSLIFMAGALEFLSKPETFFRHSISMLEEDGTILLLYPEKNLPGYIYSFKHRMNGVPCRLFSDHEMETIFLSQGLVQVSKARCGFFSKVLVLKAKRQEL